MAECSTPECSTATEDNKPVVARSTGMQSTETSSPTIRSLANKLFYPEGQTPATTGNVNSVNKQQTSLSSLAMRGMSTAADASVNFNPVSAGIRAAGDLGSSLVSGIFSTVNNNNNLSFQRDVWNRNWDAARQMGLYSPDQIGTADSNVYKLGYKGLNRTPRTRPGSAYGM